MRGDPSRGELDLHHDDQLVAKKLQADGAAQQVRPEVEQELEAEKRAVSRNPKEQRVPSFIHYEFMSHNFIHVCES